MRQRPNLEHAALLARVELFTGLDRVTLAKLAAYLEPVAVGDGATLFSQGDGTGGRLFTHRQARLAALAYGLVTLLALCASVPAWRAMGLM